MVKARTMTLPPPPAYHESSSMKMPVRVAAASPLQTAANLPIPIINRSIIPLSNPKSLRPESNLTRPALHTPTKTESRLTTITTATLTSTAAYPGHGPTLHPTQATGIPSVETTS